MADDREDAAARLDRRVAEAAEAWLTDPRDSGVYARLVAAVVERRAVLDIASRADAERDADRDDEPVVPLRPVGVDLVGDPRAVLDRLRSG